jgi:hypothetical protein
MPPVRPDGEDRVRPGGPPTVVTAGGARLSSDMDDSVIAQLGVIAAGEGSREERAARRVACPGDLWRTDVDQQSLLKAEGRYRSEVPPRARSEEHIGVRLRTL